MLHNSGVRNRALKILIVLTSQMDHFTIFSISVVTFIFCLLNKSHKKKNISIWKRCEENWIIFVGCCFFLISKEAIPNGRQTVSWVPFNLGLTFILPVPEDITFQCPFSDINWYLLLWQYMASNLDCGKGPLRSISISLGCGVFFWNVI